MHPLTKEFLRDAVWPAIKWIWAGFITLAVISLLLSAKTNAQTCPPMPSGLVCVSQSTIDRAARAADELLQARDVIAKFTVERATAQAEREAAAKLIERLNAVIAVQDKMVLEYDRIGAQYRQLIEMQAQLIDKLSTQLLKGKSSWAKVGEIVQKIAIIATGILIGRGL